MTTPKRRRRENSLEDEAGLKGLGAAIKSLRTEGGMTQGDLAKRSKLTDKAIGRIERGEVDAKWGTLRRIAIALDLELKDLLDLGVDRAPGAGGAVLRRERKEAIEHHRRRDP